MIGHIRKVVDAVPVILRPLAFIVAPLVILHALFMRGADEIVPVLPAVSTVSKTDLPTAGYARYAIEHTDEFLTPKRAVCPVSSEPSELLRSKLFYALQSAGYLTSDLDSRHLELTPEARSRLGSDLTDDTREISVVVARRIFNRIAVIDPPPQSRQPPLQYATRVDFKWKWSPTNQLGAFLEFFASSTDLNGSAYFLREPNRTWRLAEIEFNDPTPDLTNP